MFRHLSTWIGIISFICLIPEVNGSPTSAGTSSPKFPPGRGIVYNHPTAAESFIYLPRATVREPDGDILITDAGNWNRAGGKVVELNPQGKPVWVYTGDLVFPHAAYPVGKNDILISDTGDDRVIEINRQGKTIWDTDDFGGGKGFLGQGAFTVNGKRVHLLYPNDAVTEPGGRVLITSRYTNAVYEIQQKTGKVVWNCSRFMNKEHNGRLIPSGPYKGDLMVADSDNARVLIINHQCNKILFDYGPENYFQEKTILWPRTFQLYPGANFIVGDSLHDRIIEINSNKKIVKQWTNLPGPFYVTVLKNGDLLTQDSNIHGAIELSPNGQIVKQYRTVYANTYSTSIVNPSFEMTKSPGWLKGDLLTESLPAHVRANMAFDSSTAHTGKSSVRITWPANTSHLALYWFQTISVTPGKTYHFTGWMKTSKVQTCKGCDYGVGSGGAQGDAEFQADYFDPNRARNPSAIDIRLGNPQSGTTGWIKETASFTIPKGVTQMQVQCSLLGRGTVWFDDVTVTS